MRKRQVIFGVNNCQMLEKIVEGTEFMGKHVDKKRCPSLLFSFFSQTVLAVHFLSFYRYKHKNTPKVVLQASLLD